MLVRTPTASPRTALSPTLRSPTLFGTRSAALASVCLLLACDEAGRLPAGFDLAGPPADSISPETSTGADAAEDSSVDVDAGSEPADTSPADTLTTGVEDATSEDVADSGDTIATDDSSDSNDASDGIPDDDLIRPAFTTEPARQTKLISGDVTWLTVPSPQRIAMVRNGELEVLASAGATSLGPAPEQIIAATEFEGRLLVATTEALLVEVDGELVPSPLGSALEGRSVAFVSEGDALWLSTETALYRIVGSSLRKIHVPGLAIAGPLLARGLDSVGGVWLGSESGVVSLVPTAESYSALLTTTVAPSALAVDGRGHVWILANGEVQRREAREDNTWRTFALNPAPDLILADPATPHVWLVGDGVLYHAVDGNWARVEPAPPRAIGYAIKPDGTLLLGTATGLSAISPGRLLSLSGLRPRALLETATTIEVRVSDPELAMIDARVDGISVTTALDGEGTDRAFRLDLDPANLARGSHSLTVTATYSDDDTRLSASLPFEVMYITWKDEVQPLYEARCSNCHNSVAGASTAILTSPDSWESRFDCILCRVTVPIDTSSPECRACDDFASQMPPGGKLTDTDLDHLRRWRLEGFRKE